MIRMTGNAGGGAPSINALAETIEGFVGGISLGELKEELGARGIVAEVPMPTYGYLGKGEFLYRRKDDLISDWAIDALRELVHPDRKGGIREYNHSCARSQYSKRVLVGIT